MILTAEEREKFAHYLEQDARTNRLLINQLEKLPRGEPIAEKLLLDAEAEERVAKRLRSTDDQRL